MFYLNKQEKQNCTGCQACKQACPKNAITMIEDEEGFLYPKKNENCVECGICEKVCPLNNKVENDLIKQEVYAAIYNEEDILNKSSSGGAFTAICNSFCDDNYVIFGAEYDEEFKVIHGYTNNIKDIGKFRKSKYVQSDINDSYIKVKKLLQEGKKVLFSGTPCQGAGLKTFLKNKEYENLLCVDIICHGVPSPKVWKKYISYLENKYNSTIKEINFREKTKTKSKWNSRNLKIKLSNKTLIENVVKNYYLKGFHGKLFYRSSCKICQFANPNRISDITIGDCWGYNLNEKANIHKGISLVVINTQKGKQILNNLHKYMSLESLNLEFAIRENAQFREPTTFHKNRNKFYQNLDKLAFDKLIKRYGKESFKIKIKRNAGKLIPKQFKKKLKKIISKVK